MKSLILGGARSGKSRFAERIVLDAQQKNPQLRCHYVATAVAFDEEMQVRIAQHQARRGEEWTAHECPVDLVRLLSGFDAQDIVLVDCLTVWLNNVIYNDGNGITPQQIEAHVQQLVDVIAASEAQIVLVSNEVGMGIVPLGHVTRLFVDYAGWMNQAFAVQLEQVIFVAAGLPMFLKGSADEI
ncbi:bifunctional adenosylcobinamide kinase/adenosylcobinamide-phosphate guanylyltransferase [Vibrio quintilis]|uniref:Bifunctional adenosylcobalamin biosynthesis protein n=1 Tax=Vibrio quintilis TaxID=1117707 RepID=A0A1M7Z2M1_9VIBR|nr:bifunctional adenosylcobinamide kinase/adenosylcobinamide-phosphate guanylyltransferase [Vibrio quintilis]SHO59062.1 Bifunctional adenosylcobalamin biosynthesis protein CobP [Vibrio quintilis]